MPRIPDKLFTSIDRLRAALIEAPILVLDFESTGVRPRTSAAVGCGIYLPNTDTACYINLGHAATDSAFPRYDSTQLAAALRPFVESSDRHLIAHNAPFDCRWLLKFGLSLRCRISDTLIHVHRTDENLTSFSASPTHHNNVDHMSYGLKGLITVFANEAPPQLFQVTDGQNAMFAPIKATALYCIQDCVNTWFLYQFAEGQLGSDPRLQPLVQTIDDPNNAVVTKMMWEGIGIDTALAAKQKPIYDQAIQNCRDLIWNTLNIHSPLETKRDAIGVLQRLNLSDELGYDPLLLPPWADENDDPTLTGEILQEAYRELTSPDKRTVIAAFLSMWSMKQRVSAFINPLSEKSTSGRLYADRFSSTTATSRFSMTPNVQGLPGRADAVDKSGPIESLPAECREHFATRNLIVAKPDHCLVNIDLSAAEPRYLAMACQQALSVKDRDYQTTKRELARLRRERYPVLLDALYAGRAGNYQEQPFNWPTLTDDPLWKSFDAGLDPYESLLKALDKDGYTAALQAGVDQKWLKENRWRGKKAFLAIGYGIGASTLAPQLGWSLEQTKAAIQNLDTNYPMIGALKELVVRSLTRLGEIRTLWGRPRRINGYFQLARPYPLTVAFTRRRTATGRPHVCEYRADIIPMGTYRQGVTAFIEQCYVASNRQLVMAGNSDGTLKYEYPGDAFVHAVNHEQFATPPFANIPYSQIQWIQERETGLIRHLPRQAKAERQLFNSIFQGTGADHLRWLMNNVDREVCQQKEFKECQLILTVHDSLLYEVPKKRWQSFVKAAWPVLSRRPDWATLDVKIEVEVGNCYGKMKKVDRALL